MPKNLMMRHLLFLLILLTNQQAWAKLHTSYYLAHPLGWMHMLPQGEVPGWKSEKWLQFDISHGNIWNAPIDLRNTQNNKVLNYEADFEQSSYIIEYGQKLSDNLAHSVVLPYAYRDGGFLDSFIDRFHEFIGSERFNRPEFPENRSIFDIQTSGTSELSNNSANGIGNIKYKLKYWPVKWENSGNCPCGVAASAQIKIPVERARRGLTTGSTDYSLLLHLGAPLFDKSAIWFTTAVTHTPENKILKEWPRRKWHQMYELSLDLAINDKWGVIMQVRNESPMLQKEHLNIINSSSDPDEILAERVASGWNSLVHWRGSESLGLRYNTNNNGQVNFLIIEDWNFGEYDERGDRLYVNNAPDVVFAVQSQWNF